MFERKRNFQKVVVDSRLADAITKEAVGPRTEAVNLLIGVLQREEGEDVYRVYDIIQEDLLRGSGLVGRKNADGVAEKIGFAEGIDSHLLKEIEKGVKKANYDRAVLVGFSHSHEEEELPSGKDVHLMKFRYPNVLHVIHVKKGEKVYAYNGDCDLLSIKDGTLRPDEGLQVEFRDLPYHPEVAILKNKLLAKLKKKVKRN